MLYYGARWLIEIVSTTVCTNPVSLGSPVAFLPAISGPVFLPIRLSVFVVIS